MVYPFCTVSFVSLFEQSEKCKLCLLLSATKMQAMLLSILESILYLRFPDSTGAPNHKHIMKKTVSSLIICKNKILMLLRDDIPEIADPNKWQTIGGYVEDSESLDSAIKREIKEETDLTLSNIKLLGKLIRKNM